MSLPSQTVKPDAGLADLVRRGLAGERRALARLITLVENRTAEGQAALHLLNPRTGHAYILGITGAPGSGKSTLTNELIKELRRRERTIGVVAVDPTSTLTGGAVLGDRIRMLENYQDPEVFIRSMATRGQLGGLAAMTNDVVRVLDACGKDVIIVETVGVGQDEVDIARAAHTTLMVEVPGMGDDIQAIKAGVLEIADVLVINKADRDGAEKLDLYLRSMLKLAPKKDWAVPIIKTIASRGEGVAQLVDTAEKHLTYLKHSGEYERRERARLRDEVLARAREIITQQILRRERNGTALSEYLTKLENHELDVNEVAQALIREM